VPGAAKQVNTNWLNRAKSVMKTPGKWGFRLKIPPRQEIITKNIAKSQKKS
jgi:hypothetical protein